MEHLYEAINRIVSDDLKEFEKELQEQADVRIGMDGLPILTEAPQFSSHMHKPLTNVHDELSGIEVSIRQGKSTLEPVDKKMTHWWRRSSRNSSRR
jgi:hypothetical protein